MEDEPLVDPRLAVPLRIPSPAFMLSRPSTPPTHGSFLSPEFHRRAESFDTVMKAPPLSRQNSANLIYDESHTQKEFVENKAVLDARNGSVLDSQSIIKVDHFPMNLDGIKRRSRSTLNHAKISGAPQLRKCPGSDIYACAQPTIHGIRGLLNNLKANHASGTDGNVAKSVLWINLREEPIVYINGRPTVLRDRVAPFHNIDAFRGIAKDRIESLEWRLKHDIVSDAAKYGGNVLVHEEIDHREIEMIWESTPMNAILTPEEVFSVLRTEGYYVRYERIPLTPESPPPKDFMDTLMQQIISAPPDTIIVFNCHTGLTRSTFAMVAACIVQMWRGAIVAPMPSAPSEPVTSGDHPLRSPTTPKSGLTRVLSGATLNSADMEFAGGASMYESKSSTDYTTRQLKAGFYQPILNILQLLDQGRDAKIHVDYFCDMCSHLVNLRTIVYRYRVKAGEARSDARTDFKICRAATALHRYVLLVLLDAYLSEQVQRVLGSPSADSVAGIVKQNLIDDPAAATVSAAGRGSNGVFPEGFFSWISNHRELVALLSKLVKNPQKSLEVVNHRELGTLAESLQQAPQDIMEMEQAMLDRNGSMLNSNVILKEDHFPSALAKSAKKEFEVIIKGAPNFRKVPGMQVHGVCTPTAPAVERIVTYCQAAYSANHVVFINLREEPVVYINDRPFVLRSVGKPFRNVQRFDSIEASRLEAAELRLKDDILAEAKRYGGKILVHSESVEKSINMFWEDVSDDDVQTPKEMYDRLIEKGFPIDYVRIPQTAEQPPDPLDVDSILQVVQSYKSRPETHFVFNCQMGRGRSSMSMILACTELDASVGAKREETGTMVGREDDYPEYGPVLSLMRVLAGGIDAKRWVDQLIDLCGQVENIRRSIEIYSNKATKSRSTYQAKEYTARSLLNLRRYFMLLTVSAYQLQIRGLGRSSVHAEELHPVTSKQSFAQWLKSRPEIRTFYDEIHTVSPVQINKPALPSGGDNGNPGNDAGFQKDYVAYRSGMVLVPGSILKTDHFPGCNRLPDAEVVIDGAPNFRKVSCDQEAAQQRPELKCLVDLNVYGTAIPTVPAIRGILENIKETSGQDDVLVEWINLREEPILYVSGIPYVVRKQDHPFQNLEHTGISRERVEAMEARLKVDVLDEMKRNQGKVLLHDEDDTGLVPSWVHIGDAEVMTPRDVYEVLNAENFNVNYHRIPITDEQAPKMNDIDHIANVVKESPSTSHIVVNCQMGRGRTTTGMVVVSATRLWMKSALGGVEKAIDAAEQFRIQHPDAKPLLQLHSKLRYPQNQTPVDGAQEAEIKSKFLRGEYTGVTHMVKLVPEGKRAKSSVDAIIDMVDAMQNLREAIYEVKLMTEHSELGPLRVTEARTRCSQYLRRYYQLIELSMYYFSEPFTNIHLQEYHGYEKWLKARPELKNIARRLQPTTV